MNEIQQFIQNFAENEKELKTINEFLINKLEIIAANQEWAFRILKQLDLSKCSLCYLLILLAIMSSKSNQKNIEFVLLNDHLSKFFQNFKGTQLQQVLPKFYQLGEWYSEYLISVEKPIYGIKPLQQAIILIRYNNEQLTPLHREFAKLCLKAKCYQHALLIIESPSTSFKKNTSPMDILSYLYYKGLILIGLQRYQQAMDSFLLVLSLPSQIIHKVHTESYKKLLILSLITNNRGPFIPTYVSQLLKIKLENALKNYVTLQSAYLQKDDEAFKKQIEEHALEYLKDKNWGLIVKLQKQYERRRICELDNTYLTLRYNEISNQVPSLKAPQEIEETFFHMVNDGQIKAKIDQSQQMITFIDSSGDQQASEEARENEYLEVIQELEDQNKRVIELMTLSEKVNRNIKHMPEYIKKTLFDKGAGRDQDSSGDMQSQMMSL